MVLGIVALDARSPKEAQNTWMHGSAEEAFALARPYPSDGMAIVHKGEMKDAGGVLRA